MQTRLRIRVVVTAALCLQTQTASAHPSSGIVVDQQGQVFFQDAVGRAIWKIDALGHVTKYYDRLGGHWLALDPEGSFSRTSFRFAKRVTPLGQKPAILVADGGAPIVVGRDGNLYYGLAREATGVAAGLTQISPDGKRTIFSPDLKSKLRQIDGGVWGLACGPDGSLYVATWDAVFKINQQGAVTTVVHPIIVKDCDEDHADHNRSNRLPCLRGLAIDTQGTIYAAATSCHRLLKISPNGKVESILRAERPWSPTGVANHDGDVYVLEYTNANGGADEGWRPRVRRLGRDGQVKTLATVGR
jgi:hypothetical protein